MLPLPAPSLSLLERKPAAPAGARDPRAAREPSDGLGGGGLRCRTCGHLITTERARIQVAGAHEHARMNPAGVAYLIGCFRSAPGCIGLGAASDHFTWFPGFTWRIALCHGCWEHLGWHFQGEDSSFYGLILERLVPDEPARDDG